MRKLSACWMVLAIGATWFAVQPCALSAAELPWANLAFLKGTPVDIHCPQSSDQCDKEYCIERYPVRECVPGKKEVFEPKVCYEYVSIPETRYRWKTRLITKKIPCPYCMPTCTETEVDHCYESEQWDSQCDCCGELHCKTCRLKTEKLPCKHCGSKHGETNVKVCYWSCVKIPYTVYRQVKKPVCIKQPRYEHVKIPVTRYVCKHCDDPGCGGCCD